MQLYEKYRPVNFDGVVGNGKAVKKIKSIVGRGLGGRALWISGASGIGKTSIARILANSIADDLFITEYDSCDSLNTTALDEIDKTMQLYSTGKGGRCFIFNEAHGLKKAAIRRLLGMLERLPNHVCFVFTTTKDGEESLFEDSIESGPLLSRCIRIALTNQGLCKPFAKHCQRIAKAENLDGRPLAAYIKLVQRHHNNLRACFQSIESCELL